jgi:hypothetical protein
VGSAVSDGQTREFVTHAPNKRISPRRFSRAKSEDATRRVLNGQRSRNLLCVAWGTVTEM